jgi:hypothetical protein
VSTKTRNTAANLRWVQRIISRKGQTCAEDATLERRLIWSLDVGFPFKHVVFVYRTGDEHILRVAIARELSILPSPNEIDAISEEEH